MLHHIRMARSEQPSWGGPIHPHRSTAGYSCPQAPWAAACPAPGTVCSVSANEPACIRALLPQVQSFLRGWLCRRKWKTIIQDYIRSPHADSMRKRNQVVFSMLEAEAEYVQQLHILVNNFLRPLRMAASSKKPPITHDDVSSIFLNRWALAWERPGWTPWGSPPPGDIL